MIVAALNVDITEFHTNLVPPYPRIHFMLTLLALLPHGPRRGARSLLKKEFNKQHAVEKRISPHTTPTSPSSTRTSCRRTRASTSCSCCSRCYLMYRGEVAAEEGLQHASVARGLEPSGKWGPFNEAALFVRALQEDYFCLVVDIAQTTIKNRAFNYTHTPYSQSKHIALRFCGGTVPTSTKYSPM